MSNDTEVVLKGGGENLYFVKEYDGKFYVYKGGLGLFAQGKKNTGEASSLDKALVLIKAQTGKEIDRLRDC